MSSPSQLAELFVKLTVQGNFSESLKVARQQIDQFKSGANLGPNVAQFDQLRFSLKKLGEAKWLNTDQGKEFLKLNREIQRETDRTMKATRPFSDRIREVASLGTAIPAMVAGSAAMGAVGAASPDVFRTVTGSFQLLAAQLGIALIPAAIRLAREIQNVAEWFHRLRESGGLNPRNVGERAGLSSRFDINNLKPVSATNLQGQASRTVSQFGAAGENTLAGVDRGVRHGIVRFAIQIRRLFGADTSGDRELENIMSGRPTKTGDRSPMYLGGRPGPGLSDALRKLATAGIGSSAGPTPGGTPSFGGGSATSPPSMGDKRAVRPGGGGGSGGAGGAGDGFKPFWNFQSQLAGIDDAWSRLQQAGAGMSPGDLALQQLQQQAFQLLLDGGLTVNVANPPPAPGMAQ